MHDITMRSTLFLASILSASLNASPLKLQATCNYEAENNINYFSITFISNDEARVEVNSNQIYINVKAESEELGHYTFKSVDDIGLAGASLNWDKFSKDRAVFSLRKINTRDYVIEWYGFFDTSVNHFTWVDIGSKGPDLYSQKSVIYNCQYY